MVKKWIWSKWLNNEGQKNDSKFLRFFSFTALDFKEISIVFVCKPPALEIFMTITMKRREKNSKALKIKEKDVFYHTQRHTYKCEKIIEKRDSPWNVCRKKKQCTENFSLERGIPRGVAFVKKNLSMNVKYTIVRKETRKK